MGARSLLCFQDARLCGCREDIVHSLMLRLIVRDNPPPPVGGGEDEHTNEYVVCGVVVVCSCVELIPMANC